MIVPDKALLPSITNSISQIQNDSRRTLPAWATRCPEPRPSQSLLTYCPLYNLKLY